MHSLPLTPLITTTHTPSDQTNQVCPYLSALWDLPGEDEDVICAGDVPGVEPRVVGGPHHAGPLGAPVQLVVTLSVGHQPALELGLEKPGTGDFIQSGAPAST